MTEEALAGEGTITTAASIEKNPKGVVRRWLMELDLAAKEESDWRDEATKVWQKYEAEKVRKNSFNILWANSEVLQGALYNSTPEPDVRRRFRQGDPVGKAVATVLERALSYEIDTYDFDILMDDVVLDVILPGRGLARVKYKPTFAPIRPPTPGSEAPPGNAVKERLTGQQVECEHVQWSDFRRGPGKTWNMVTWIAFRHEFTQEMAAEAFGPELAAKLKYSEGPKIEKSAKGDSDADVKMLFQTTEVWEIWDKERKRVLFIAPCYKVKPCKEVPDPLKLTGFWPIPRPIYAICNSRTLVPKTLYSMYVEQAEELNQVSSRINRLVHVLRVRGAYSSNLPELKDILEADDTEMIAVANVSEIATIGGLDRALWIMPIKDIANALKELYLARDQIKQVIYEIVGIADIMRGASDPNETLGAQEIKTKWGSIRLRKVQKEIARFVRDLLRLKAEVIAEQFSLEQLKAMTGLELPMQAEKQKAQLILQQAMANGQPPPQNVQIAATLPSWEEVMVVMRSDQMRQYKVDIETDSTVQETIERDMQGLNEVMGGLERLMTGAMPMIQAGIMKVGDVKQVALAITRRARMGAAVEDSIQNWQEPAVLPGAGMTQVPGGEAGMLEESRKRLVQAAQGEGQKLIAQQKQQDEAAMAIQNATAAATQAAQVSVEVANQQNAALQQERQIMAKMVEALGTMMNQDRQQASEVMLAISQAIGQLATVTGQQTQQVLQLTQDALLAIGELVEQLQQPKKVTFDRAGPGDRIQGATVTPVTVQ